MTWTAFDFDVRGSSVEHKLNIEPVGDPHTDRKLVSSSRSCSSPNGQFCAMDLDDRHLYFALQQVF